MAKFITKSQTISAVQLLWSTWNEMCEHTGAGEEGIFVGCYVDRETRQITEDTNGLIGMKIPPELAATRCLAIENDWVVRLDDGKLAVVADEVFRETFMQVCEEDGCGGPAVAGPKPICAQHLHDSKAAERPEVYGRAVTRFQHSFPVPLRGDAADVLARLQRHTTYFEVNWSKYPKLASVFEHRPQVNVYWEELRALLVEARAEAVQFIRDVRADELAKAAAGGTDPTSISVRRLSDEQLVTALNNVGCYIGTCDACAEVFFTGSKMHDHTCPKGR